MRDCIRLLYSFFFVMIIVTPRFGDTLSTDQEVQLPNIAVLTLRNSEGISEGDAALITDRLNIDLFKTSRVNLLERDQIKDILQEQGFQGSGACTDEACLVEVGQILGVKEIITGSLGRLGTLIIINLRSIDVSTGQIVKVVSQDIPGKLEDVIYYLPNIARKLVGLEEIPMEKKVVKETPSEQEQEKEQPEELKPAQNTGMLVVKTIPAGAAVILNNKKVGVTPFTDNTLLPAEYNLKISIPRFETYTESFELAAGYTKVVAQNLVYKYGLLTIFSKPAGAAVEINGKEVGVTPYQNNKLKPGEHKLYLFLKDYQPISEKFQVQKHTRDTLSYTLFTAEKLDSVRAEKREMKRGRRNARRIIFGVLAVGAWGTGLAFNSIAKTHNDKADKLYDEYKSLDPEDAGPIKLQEFNDKYLEAKSEKDEANKNALIRNILYGSGGLFTLLFTISIPF